MSKFDDIDQRDVSFATLDTTDVVAVQMCQLCEFLLREATLIPQLTQPSAELDSRIVGGWHAPMFRCCTL